MPLLTNTQSSNNALKYMKQILSGSLSLSSIVVRLNESEDVDSVLSRLSTGAVLVIIHGKEDNQQPLERFSVESSPESQRLMPIVPYMKRIYSILENVFPQQLLPMTIAVRSFHEEVGVVYDIGRSRIVLNERIVQYLDSTPIDKLVHSYSVFTDVINNATRNMKDGDNLLQLLNYLSIDTLYLLGTNVVVCAACVLLLSVLFPYVVNYVLINLALTICRDMGWQTMSSYCMALWTSAIALAFILLPALANAIFIICQVQSCAN